jgi:hypothetical protein
MSLHPLPEPTPRHGRRPFAILRILAVVVGVATAAVGIAAAGDPTPATGKVPPASSAVADVVLARSALVALDADADLKGINLVVSVVDRSAVIGGPVANARQSRRAEEVVRAVPGIADVRNNCFVALGPDPLLRALADRMGSTLPPRPTMYDLPGVLTNHLTPAAPLPESAPVNPATFASADPPGTVVVRKPPGEPGLLGAPVGPAVPGSVPTPSLPPTTPVVLTGTVPPVPGNANAVLVAAHEVRKADARFARLTVELREGTLVVGGSAPLAADAWDFAQKLRSVPGVTRIAVGAVAGK